MSFFSVSFGISFEHAVQLPFTVFLYSPFPDNYAFLSLSPSQIKNIQSADTVPVHGHSPLVKFDFSLYTTLLFALDLAHFKYIHVIIVEHVILDRIWPSLMHMQLSAVKSVMICFYILQALAYREIAKKITYLLDGPKYNAERT